MGVVSDFACTSDRSLLLSNFTVITLSKIIRSYCVWCKNLSLKELNSCMQSNAKSMGGNVVNMRTLRS